ncbi:MAG: BspA family leucine-rich repeat surface protein, partial [Bacteroidales bacterium]|nr:BspA family leucine-rich repeat surface protein [Bacteroidales bacterium]
TDMSWMFYWASDFNQDLSAWDVSNVINMKAMFNIAMSFDQDIGSWDVSSVTDMSFMFSSVTLSTANYNSLLTGWEALDLYDGVNFHGGSSKYHPGAPAIARANIISDDSWTITDGGEIPTCPAPTSQTESNILLSSADLEWISGGATTWDIEYGPNGFIQGTGTMVSALSSNSYSLTGLSEQTVYDWYVRDDCGGGDLSPWTGPSTFATSCSGVAITSFPFNEGFNSSSATQNCWTVLNENSDGDEWDMDYTSYVYEGDEVAAMNTDNNSGNNDDYLITPQLTLNGNQQLTFWYRVRRATEPNDFEILLSTTGNTVADFTTTLKPIATYSNESYDSIKIDLSSYSGDVYISWHVPAGGLDGWLIFIDEVIVQDIPTCPQPYDQTESGLTSLSAKLEWTSGGASTWGIEYGPTGYTQGAGTSIDDITSNPYTLSGLSASTAYDWYVRDDCGVGDLSLWTGPHTFTTACEAFTTFPFNEGFNSSSTTQSCWTILDENGDGDEWDMDYTSSTYEGDEVASIYTSGNNGNNDDYLISPQLTLSGNEQVSFFYRAGSEWNPNDLELLLSTTGFDAEDFTTTLIPNFSFNNTVYSQIVVNLSAYSGNVFIAWHVASGGLGGNRIYIDNVTVDPADACPQPMLQTAVTGPGLANLGWIENGTTTTWDIEWGADGFTQGTGTTVSGISSNPYNLSGLSPETNYDWYVRADCGGGSTSNWTGPHSFSTTDGKATNPTPADNAEAVSLSITELDWDDVFGADGYLITIGTTSGGNDIANTIACASSDYQYASWTGNTEYFWSVTTLFNSGSTVTANEWDFTLECDPMVPDYSEDFSSYIPNCWSEAQGFLSLNTIFTSNSSNWTDDDFANDGSNGKSAKTNIYSTSKREWMISPTFDLSG